MGRMSYFSIRTLLMGALAVMTPATKPRLRNDHDTVIIAAEQWRLHHCWAMLTTVP
jgi:hypothetical protein